MEKELKGSAITWSVLRPVAFLENLDDKKNGNPLKKGSLKMLTKSGCSIEYIAAADIGKGSVELLMNPQMYKYQKVDAATCEYTGPELAQILSEVSGTKCKYSISVPRFVLRMFVNNLYHLVTWFETEGYEKTDIEAFRRMVPDYQDAKDWFAAKGQWDDGEKFKTAIAA